MGISEQDPNELPKMMATCRFCGQTRLVQTVGDVSQDKLDEVATDQCDCSDAKVYHNRQQKIRRASEWADGYFENRPSIITLVKTAFQGVTNHDCEQVQIKDGEWTHTIYLDSDGYLTVKSGKKITEEQSFC